jgi:hypothetical protein
MAGGTGARTGRSRLLAYTASAAYARQNGKPVVCIWGFGFNDSNHPGTWEQFTLIPGQLTGSGTTRRVISRRVCLNRVNAERCGQLANMLGWRWCDGGRDCSLPRSGGVVAAKWPRWCRVIVVGRVGRAGAWRFSRC